MNWPFTLSWLTTDAADDQLSCDETKTPDHKSLVMSPPVYRESGDRETKKHKRAPENVILQKIKENFKKF